MQVETTVQPTYTRVRLKGSFTYDGRIQFKEAIDKATQAGCTKLLVDLQEVSFLDSAALGILVLTNRKFTEEKRQFGLLKPTDQGLKLLTIAGIHKIIPVYQSEQEATAVNAA